jgi:hypothetical protein
MFLIPMFHQLLRQKKLKYSHGSHVVVLDSTNKLIAFAKVA